MYSLQAYKNDIPVFCPAITDGSIGDMLYFFSYKRKLVIDVVEDIRLINDIAVKAPCTGMFVLLYLFTYCKVYYFVM